MELYDIYKLESLNDKEFLNYLREFSLTNSYQECIGMIRVSGKCFDIYRGMNQKNVNKILKEMTKSYPDKEIDLSLFKTQIESLDHIFKEFLELRELTGVNTIPVRRQISAFLIALEILLGSSYEQLNDKKPEQLKEVYPFYLSLFDDFNKKAVDINFDKNTFASVADSITEFSGNILKFLYSSNSEFYNNAINMNQIKLARKHIELFDKWAEIISLEEKWRLTGISIKVSEKEITISTSEEEEKLIYAEEISRNRFSIQRERWYTDFLDLNKASLKDRISKKCNELPPIQYLCEEEIFYCICVSEFLNTYSLETECLNIPLSEWIRGYTILQLEGKSHLQERSQAMSVRSLNLNQWIIEKNEKEWIDLFVGKGISYENSKIIISNLVFSKDSKDLLDCPFISRESDSLILLPSVAAGINPSMSLISLLTKKGVDISFKGKGYEEEVLKTLNKHGIRTESLKNNFQDEEFECDAAFILENNLFFVELKAYGQPSTLKEYYNLINKLSGFKVNEPKDSHQRGATEQLNRISDFYMQHMHLVSKKFDLPVNWIPKNVYKIVITTAMLGQPLFLNGCYIIDNSAFSRFLGRKPPALKIGDRKIYDYHKDFDGEITTEKLLNFLKNPVQIALAKKKITKVPYSFHMGSKRLNYPILRSTLSNATKLNQQQYKEISEKLNFK